MKTVIHEFDPVIYPRKLWICINPSTVDLEGSFVIDTKYGGGDLKFDKFYSLATTSPVFKKDGNYRGVLICFKSRMSADSDIISHESVHAADYICEELGIKGQDFSENNEAYAYLVGWISKCCGEVKKFKKTKHS